MKNAPLTGYLKIPLFDSRRREKFQPFRFAGGRPKQTARDDEKSESSRSKRHDNRHSSRFAGLFASVPASAVLFVTAGAAQAMAGDGIEGGPAASRCKAPFDFKLSLLRAGMKEAGWPSDLMEDILQSHGEAVKNLLSPRAGKVWQNFGGNGTLDRFFGKRVTAKMEQISSTDGAYEAWRLFESAPSVRHYINLSSALRGVTVRGGIVVDRFVRISRAASSSLQRSPLSSREISVIQTAHEIGRGGPDKDSAGRRWTPGELRLKSRFLQAAGFSRADRERLIRDGVTGLSVIPSAETAVYIPDPEKTAPRQNLKDVWTSQMFGSYLTDMTDPENVRHNRANYDSVFNYILRHHLEQDGGWTDEPDSAVDSIIMGIFNSSEDREVFDYSKTAAEDLILSYTGKRKFRRMTKKPLSAEEIYTPEEILGQKQLLQKAGYFDKEAQRILNGEGALQFLQITSYEFNKLTYNVGPYMKTARFFESLPQNKDIDWNDGGRLSGLSQAIDADRKTYLKKWEAEYQISPPAAQDLWFHIMRHIADNKFMKQTFNLTNDGIEPYQLWLSENTL